MKLVITVKEIRGKCPVYKLGDRITLRQGYILDPADTDIVCMHSLASIFPYYVALTKGVSARELSLDHQGSPQAYVQCLDPCDLTGGGTVRLEIARID